jgi:hypothetical protein
MQRAIAQAHQAVLDLRLGRSVPGTAASTNDVAAPFPLICQERQQTPAYSATVSGGKFSPAAS